MKEEKDLLKKSLVCSIKDGYISAFIQLFMKKEIGHIKEVTYGDFIELAKGTSDTRCQRVALFRSSVRLIWEKLKKEKMTEEARIAINLSHPECIF
ncbi:MAG: hypothetical protein NTX85_02365 [Candidatus Nomurabacteria bacterium]|nr:hypothetical protein [Candidatus Nomurabacteria bacterium]